MKRALNAATGSMPVLLALFVACVVPVRAQERVWAFHEGSQGWRTGLGPVAWALTDSSTRQLEQPLQRSGALAIMGRAVDRYFLDATGLVRRGRAKEEWLLSPALDRPAASCSCIRIQLRGSAGAELLTQLEWVTAAGHRALTEITRRQAELAPPDSVQAAVQAYRRGTLGRSRYQAFMERWQGDGAGEYAAALGRLRQETAALQALFQTQEQVIVLRPEIQTVEIDVHALPGWQGELRRIGVRLAQPPALQGVLRAAAGADQPFVEVTSIALAD